MRIQFGKLASAIVVAANGFQSRAKRDCSGATSIEYSLIIAMMALVCIGGFKALGGSSGGAWGTTANLVTAAMAK